MKSFALTTAMATIAALGATPAVAQYNRPSTPPPIPQATQQPATPGDAAEAPAIKLSKQAGKAIIELQTAVRANDVATIPAKVAAAKAVATTADDRYAIGRLELNAATAAKDNEAAVLAVDDIAASRFLPNQTVASLYNSIGVTYFNAKNAPRATAMFQKALAIDPNNAETLRLMAESQTASGSPAEAITAMRRAMAQANASGQKLAEVSYKRAVNVAYQAKDPAAVEFSRDWIKNYPGVDSWSNGIAIYRNLMRPDVEGTLDLLRLQRAANALQRSGEYTLYATAAAEQGNFAEAQSVIDEGLANKKVDPTTSLARDIINGLKTKPKASAAELEAAARNAKTANSMIAVGNRYYGISNYARAAELYRSALGAGGDSGLANLHLGMALARAGDKAGATTALNAVTGTFAGIAKYWLLFVHQAG